MALAPLAGAAPSAAWRRSAHGAAGEAAAHDVDSDALGAFSSVPEPGARKARMLARVIRATTG